MGIATRVATTIMSGCRSADFAVSVVQLAKRRDALPFKRDSPRAKISKAAIPRTMISPKVS